MKLCMHLKHYSLNLFIYTFDIKFLSTLWHARHCGGHRVSLPSRSPQSSGQTTPMLGDRIEDSITYALFSEENKT